MLDYRLKKQQQEQRRLGKALEKNLVCKFGELLNSRYMKYSGLTFYEELFFVEI